MFNVFVFAMNYLVPKFERSPTFQRLPGSLYMRRVIHKVKQLQRKAKKKLLQLDLAKFKEAMQQQHETVQRNETFNNASFGDDISIDIKGLGGQPAEGAEEEESKNLDEGKSAKSQEDKTTYGGL